MATPFQSRAWFSDRLASSLPGTEQLSIWLLLGITCIGLSWVLPGHYLPWPAFYQEMAAAAGLALLAGAAVEQSRRILFPRLAFFALACGLIPMLQWASGQISFRGDAIICFLYLSAFALSVCTGATLSTIPRRLQVLNGFIWCLVAVALVSTGMATSQWLGPSVFPGLIEAMPPGGRPYANMGQPNNLATLLLLGSIAILYLFEQQRVGPLTAAVSIAWLGWGIALTQSRTAWLALAILAAWWFAMRRRVGLRTSGVAIVVGCAAFAAVVRLLPDLQAHWYGPNEFEGSQVRLTAGTRSGHWASFWESILRAPWFGYGWNQVAAAQYEVAVDFPAIREWAMQSHNLVLDLLIYNGLPLGLLICAGLVAWFLNQIARCHDRESWCLLVMLFVLFAHALLEYPLHYSFFLLPAGLLMGFVGASGPEGHRPVLLRRSTLAAPTLALTLLAAGIGYEYTKAADSLRDLDLATLRIGRAAEQLPSADWFFLDGWASYHWAVALPITGGLKVDEVEKLGQVARRYAYPNVLERFAQAAALNGRAADAKHALLHSCKVHSRSVCDGMHRRWKAFASQHVDLQGLTFPVLTN